MILATVNRAGSDSKPKAKSRATAQSEQKCVVCGGVLNSAGVCLSCDTYTSVLSDGKLARTALLPLSMLEKTEAGKMPIGNATTANAHPIQLIITGKALFVPSAAEITLGRRSDQTTKNLQHIDIDLQPFDAEEKGVSRVHARLTRRDNMVFITDLNSTNGTRLNDRRLVAGSERLLRDGDVLQLGSLRIVVSFRVLDAQSGGGQK